MADLNYTNTKLEEFKKNIKDKKVAVIGIGVSNTPLIKYLTDLGVDVTAFDKQQPEKLGSTYELLSSMGVKFSLGEDYLKYLNGFDVIFKSPGIRPDLPEFLQEIEKGAELTSEMEVFLDLCPAQVLAVTGSDGKTTTTTLIYKILAEEGYKCWLGGNIGIPLLSKIDEVMPEDKVILELSSFQLQTIKKSANIAVITNISPNHLDIHKSMEEYVEAKKSIYKYQGPEDVLVINYDNEVTREIGSEWKGKYIYFSRLDDVQGVIIKDNAITLNIDGKTEKIIDIDEILIPGVHNVENYMAATAAVYRMVSLESIRTVARTFAGVEHRIELVRELNGVKYYNDSIASSPSRTIAGLNSFKQKVILIAGGYDKKIPYDVMGEPIINKVKLLILLGKTGPKIKQAYLDECERKGISPEIPIIEAQSIEDAVKTAREKSQSGDIVTLSPASASFDMFKNFEERGNKFKEIVNGL